MTKIFSFALLLLSFLSLFSTTSAQAASIVNNDILIVNARSGVNVRDKNCNKISSVGFQTEVSNKATIEKLPLISCTIKGVTQSFTPVGYKSMSNDTGYIATEYLTPVTGNFFSPGSYKVATQSGLNVRNQNCKKITAIANNVVVRFEPSDAFTICKVGNQYYLLQGFDYKGQVGYVATAFLK